MTPQEYFTNHTLNEEFLKRLGWTWDDNKITIPIYDEKAKILFERYRHLSGETKFTAQKGSHPTLYPLYKIIKHKQLVMCEGEPDCARLWQEGIPTVTATSGVKVFNPKIAEPLADKEIFLVLDNDEAGQTSMEKYVEILTKVNATIKIVELPEGYKDVSDYFTAGFTKKDFQKLMDTAISFDEWTEKHEPETFALETAAELVKQDIPAEQWLVDRILPVEGFCFFVGAEATGKTFYTLTLADSVVNGTPWLGKFDVKIPGKVLIIDKENTKRRIQSRMKGLSIDSPDIYRVSYPHFFEIADPEAETGFTQFALSLSRKVKKLGIKLVIIDAFTDILVGNENDRGEVQTFFDAMRQLFPGVSILVLHHASKPAPGVVRTSAQRARGSTNIMAQVYSAFYVESVAKSKNEFIIEQTKAGDSEKINRFMIELVSEPDPTSPGNTVVTHIEHRGEVQDAEMKLQEAVEMIEEMFKATSQISRQELIDSLQAEGVSQRTVGRAIKQLQEDKMLDAIPDPNNKSKRFYVWMGSKKEQIYEE